MSRLAALLAIMIFVLLPPAPANARTVMVGVCGDGNLRISIPFKAPLPGRGDHGCCNKGCHAANEPKKKADGTIDDGCC